MILAIDPGNIQSAYVVLHNDLSPAEIGLIPNEELLEKILFTDLAGHTSIQHLAIEMIASYGMPVGKEVFDTVFWIGRFWQAMEMTLVAEQKLIYRQEEKLNLCHVTQAKDGNIIQALKDRFGDKGTKKNPGWFYGFKADIWQAYAVGVTYHDLYLDPKKTRKKVEK